MAPPSNQHLSCSPLLKSPAVLLPQRSYHSLMPNSSSFRCFRRTTYADKVFEENPNRLQRGT
ncbi:hypothetical protein BRADI_5g27065v3 [Brachypodium distachyon]|uniref:Uncharacterized protein n=1 Tax=Brachypodium distachyon TaxID=15368 RepID=A0A0Q3ECL8_BRADI|nr:hypothetical protein BRADI_5g27065v3 [Brachypodium distachyon]